MLPKPASLRLLALVLLLLQAPALRAELRSLEILRREPFVGGMAFGDVGPYEKITAIAHFAVDPNHPRNKQIVDLSLAPRNRDGKVEFESDVCILAPKDPARGNGAILYDVNNRGNKLALGMFNSAPGSNNPTTAEHAGNGFLFRRGYTVVWCGWIGELLPGNNRLLLRAPIAQQDGKPIRGLVRFETGSDTEAKSLPLSRREGHGSYPPTAGAEAKGVLTYRMRETDERVLIPNGQWSLERRPVPKSTGVPGTLGQVRLHLAGGFRPGYLYELICECEGPIVQGLGHAAVRDLISFLKHDTSPRHPLRRSDGKAPLNRAHGFGVSQSGRCLRHFLYQNFNVDEQGRKVFDGLMPHVAGGGLGFFNHRFAQPTRHNAQHEEHLYPTDVFPFTYGDSTNPSTKKTDGILHRTRADDPLCLPRVMHTQSAAEYWHRSGSLVHTDPLGENDAVIPGEVRIYAFGGTQHGPAANPPGRSIGDNLLNPADYKPFLRALLDALDNWAVNDKAPPASVYPRLDSSTLTGWKQADARFPSLPGIRYPSVIQQPHCLDLGPEFESKGIITVNPPRKLGDYRVRVARCDQDGNELGMLRLPEVTVPLATYTGWNLRRRDVGAEAMLVSLAGSYLPFPRTRAERSATGDPRRSIEERYGSFEEYRKRFAEACHALQKERYLLTEDVERLQASRDKVRTMFEPGKKD